MLKLSLAFMFLHLFSKTYFLSSSPYHGHDTKPELYQHISPYFSYYQTICCVCFSHWFSQKYFVPGVRHHGHEVEPQLAGVVRHQHAADVLCVLPPHPAARVQCEGERRDLQILERNPHICLSHLLLLLVNHDVVSLRVSAYRASNFQVSHNLTRAGSGTHKVVMREFLKDIPNSKRNLWNN